MKDVSGLQTERNRMDPNASVPEGWAPSGFTPKRVERTDNVGWGTVAVVLGIVAVIGLILVFAPRPIASVVMLVAGVAFGLAFYFLPTIIAVRRHHRQQTPILVCNLLLGWTFIGWVVTLVWSLVKQR